MYCHKSLSEINSAEFNRWFGMTLYFVFQFDIKNVKALSKSPAAAFQYSYNITSRVSIRQKSFFSSRSLIQLFCSFRSVALSWTSERATTDLCMKFVRMKVAFKIFYISEKL